MLENHQFTDDVAMKTAFIYREWDATRSPKIRGFKRFFDFFMLLFPLLIIIYERSKFLGDVLFLVSSILSCLLFVALLFF